MIYDVEDTIVAVASALGAAGRGIVRLSGPDVVPFSRRFFTPQAGDWNPTKRAVALPGEWKVAADRAGLPATLYLWTTGRSYTRQPTAELHTIGSPPLLERILTQLCGAGARLAQPGEFTLRAFLAGRLDLPQAEAVLGVIEARDRRQLHTALTQLAGGLSTELTLLRSELLDLCADIEAGLDFVDEDIEFVQPAEITEVLTKVSTTLQGKLRQIDQRDRTDRMPTVLLRGRPNVGKSTLWNSLTQRDAAIVSDTPGTTRDYLVSTLSLDGQDFRLIDTAGLDDALGSELDQASQQLAREMSDKADVTILCLDASRPLAAWELNELTISERVDLVVLNKIDCGLSAFSQSLPDRFLMRDHANHVSITVAQRGHHAQETCERHLVKLSAASGSGLSELERGISQLLKERLAEEGSLLAATATRCRDSLQKAFESTQRCQRLVDLDAGHELLAAEVRTALEQLGLILGAVYTEDILDRIFSRFCIGK